MPDVEKMFDVPLGPAGGPEYVAQEQKAAEKILRQRVEEAIEQLQSALDAEDSELKAAKTRNAVDTLERALGNAKLGNEVKERVQ